MITLTFKDLNEGNFNTGLQKLGMCRFPPKLAYRVCKINYKIEQQFKIARKGFGKIIEDFKVTHGPDGKLPPSKEAQEKFEAAQKAFLEQSFQIDLPKLRLEDIEALPEKDLQITPFEFEAIKPLIEGLDEELSSSEDPSTSSQLPLEAQPSS